MTDALFSGLLAGYGIAVPVGAMSVLLVTLSARTSLRIGAAGALGIAAVDGLYAGVAVIGGAVLAPRLQPVQTEVRLAAGAALVVMAVVGLRRVLREHRDAVRAAASASSSASAASEEDAATEPAPASPLRTFLGMAGLTLLNPTTVVYFAALVLGERTGVESGTGRLVFVVAALLASASWQVLLACGGALLGKALTGRRARLATGVIGNVVILALAGLTLASA
jgi:arginine exporter protein ArgO